jgi:prepilin-type N-terminal cleavage/methylation domain-containing protein/prepilin-type processing-associated H-X9-DG protein
MPDGAGATECDKARYTVIRRLKAPAWIDIMRGVPARPLPRSSARQEIIMHTSIVHAAERPIRLPRRNAFTLIELLVVIAVISILAAILFPAFAKAREQARKIVCISNTRQLGMAFFQYTQDYDAYPLSGQHSGTPACAGKPNGSWVLPNNITTASSACSAATLPVPNGSLFSYVKSPQVYKCPSDPLADQKTLSYSMNTNLSAVAESAVEAPSECVLLVDESASLDNGNFKAPTATDASGAPAWNDLPTDRHNGVGVFSFADGHSKAIHRERLKVENFTLAGP